MTRHWMLVAVIGVLGLTTTPTQAATSQLKLTITPEHAHISPGNDISIMCKADAPLTHCQFKFRNSDVYDLSDGFFSPYAKEYAYYGEGLENGECGMTLRGQAIEFVVNIVGCRARSNTSDWAFRETAVISKRQHGMDVTVSPGQTLVVLPEQPMNLLVDAHKPLTRCAYVLTNDFSGVNENRRFNYDQDNVPDASNPKGTDIDYYGTGVSKGQCGFQVPRVSDEVNDGVFVDVYDGQNHEETLFFRIIVARVPLAPILVYNETINADGTLDLNAWCSARSRPAGNITWYLNGEPIENKFLEFVPTDVWLWPSNRQTVTQKLTLKLVPELHDKDLWCAVEHVALPAPKESERIKIEIKSTPPLVQTITPEKVQNTVTGQLKLTITPEHAHVTPGNDVSIMCKADAPLTHCQFKVHNFPVIDLSAGFFSPSAKEFSYYGKGLENGECGVTFSGEARDLVYVVGCRVRSQTSDWAFREMALVNKRRGGINVTVTPAQTLVVLPGEPIKILVDAHKPLTQCSCVLNNDFGQAIENRRFNFNGNNLPRASNPKGTDMDYYGTGVSKGQCGLQMPKAREEFNDGAFVDVFDSEEHEETFFFRIVVARPPMAPKLVYNTTVNADGTLDFDAWCFVRSRPAGNITWYLGGEPVEDKFSQFVPAEDWLWPSNFQTVIQKLTLKLGREFNGKDLWCTVEHLALRTPIESKRIKIEIILPPSAPTLQVKSPYLSEGSVLEASCTVNNWQPDAKVTWYLGGVVLRQDKKNDGHSETSITQRLSHLLKPHENGLELRCEVVHSALPQPLQATSKILFTYCSPLISKTVRISCSVAGEQVDCAQPQQVGTIAQLTCKPGYIVASTIVFRRVTCLRAVRWDRDVFQCTPACGKRNTNSGTTLVSRGEDSKIGEFPWHIGIYEKMSVASKPEQICGGTLISPNTVVSAAHCFWHNEMRRKKDSSHIRVVAGKHIRDWDDKNLFVQKRNVSEIIIPLRYSGRLNQFASDIALLRLTVEVELTATVNVICIDWDSVLERAQLREGRMGTVAGWGYTEDGHQSPMLKYVNLPYVSAKVCARSLSDAAKPVFTHDKFCAGYVNRSTSVCRGDSGGGLVFRDPGTDKYYLRGIVSIAFTPPSNNAICYSQLYTGFTKFSIFLTWVQENV